MTTTAPSPRPDSVHTDETHSNGDRPPSSDDELRDLEDLPTGRERAQSPPPDVPQPQSAEYEGKARDPLALPGKDKLREIAARQEATEKEILARRAAERGQRLEGDERQEEEERREQAAAKIQKNYRGYKSRREMGGRTLSSTVRWKDVLREAQYRNTTRPRPRAEEDKAGGGSTSQSAKDQWKRAGKIVRRAEDDDTSDTSGAEGMSEASLASYRRRKRESKAEREQYAKTMGLEYFLEMVDQKHRYGSSLRRYHEVWQQSSSRDNFFYWLDHGSGLQVDLDDRPRKRLDEEQIRYLSREERKRYLVHIGEDGMFYWAKDGRPITTSPDFRDSVDGIVAVASKVPTWRETMAGKDEVSGVAEQEEEEGEKEDTGSVSGISVGHNEEPDRYTNQDLHEAKGIDKVRHLSAGAVMNRLLRKTTKKNTWIFVADTSFRLYVGIKQSGAFQHSSFLHGGRVSAAGLIRIKRGQLRKLDPLSGHYAPPVRNFRGFVHNLREAGANMDKVNVSRAYAVLVGLETYVGAKKRVRRGEQKVVDLFRPGEKRAREDEMRDKSESAEKERRTLERERREREVGSAVGQDGGTTKVLRKLGVSGEQAGPAPRPARSEPQEQSRRGLVDRAQGRDDGGVASQSDQRGEGAGVQQDDGRVLPVEHDAGLPLRFQAG